MKRILIALGILLLLLAGCAAPIEDVKTDENIDSEVSVKGEVMGSIKIGDLSGYTLKDETGEIFVASQELPEDGDIVAAKGTLKKLPILNTYYIETEK